MGVTVSEITTGWCGRHLYRCPVFARHLCGLVTVRSVRGCCVTIGLQLKITVLWCDAYGADELEGSDIVLFMWESEFS